MQDHIKNYANFSVDPCNDFYAHACPSGVGKNFMEDLKDLKIKLVQEYKESNNDFVEFNIDNRIGTENYVKELMNNIDNLCQERVPSNFLDCKQKAHKIFESTMSEAYEDARLFLISAIDAYVASTLVEQLDVKARDLFKKLKTGVLRALKKTPWAKTKGSIEMFSEELNGIEFSTFSDYREAVKNVLDVYRKTKDDCMDKTRDIFTGEEAAPICDMIATHKAAIKLNGPINGIDELDKDVVSDRLQMFNSLDKKVYIGNDFMLLLSTDIQSDLFGSIGFSLTHEIMHTLVFDYKDVQAGKPLIPFWTNNSDCVKEQARKTCNTFPTIYNYANPEEICNTTLTFEEDAADLTAYRIAWNEYQRSYTRKTVVSNYESLDKKQLFFYGAAIFFCHPMGMERTLFDEKKAHSNNYQRVNSLMSQMDEFADAFKCKPTDKMVMNKATHCELYGKKAPMTRKNSVGK